MIINFQIFSIAFLLPYTVQADGSCGSAEDDSKSCQHFPKVRTNNLRSSEHKYRGHHPKEDYSTEEASEECQCTCEDCAEKACCDKRICNECLLQQSSVMLIPYNYPYMMSEYNMGPGSLTPVTIQNATTTPDPNTIATQRLPLTASHDLTEQQIIRDYILGKIREEKQLALKHLKAEVVMDLQTTPPRRVDKSIFKPRRFSDENGDGKPGNPFDDVESLLQYVKSVREEKVRPEMKDTDG